MEMRAIEDIAIGQDLTPPLRPLAFVLRDSALSSHCSACLSTLPPPEFPPFAPAFPQNPYHVPIDTPSPLYCSPSCSSLDSPLHLSSGEPHLHSLLLQSPTSTWNDDSSDLRLSLRLVHIFGKLPQHYRFSPKFPGSMSSDQKNGALERIAGLMTNRENLLFGENRNHQFQCSDEGDNSDENDENILERIREGAKVIAKARRMCLDENVNVEKQDEFVLEEMVLCLVLTNAVEVQDKSGCCIGVAVYETAFSWINHSCSPNACYRFLMGLEDNVELPALRITPAAKSGCGNGYDNGFIMEGDVEKNGYGPRIIVRSIKAVNKGEEVTIAYTDLLQPKEMRRAELWSKYRFSCSCKRCGAMPEAYVDNALQTIYHPVIQYGAVRISKLAHSRPLKQQNPRTKRSKITSKLKLHPYHYLSLNAYTALSSAYKVHASDLSVLNSDIETQKLEAFKMYKTSAAYSLLLAGAAHHLFTFESSLVTTVANFWMNAGESMLNLSRSFLWAPFLNLSPTHLEFLSVSTQKCNCRCLGDILEPNSRNMEFEELKSRLHKCIENITPKVWSMLASESSFLKKIRNPIDFSWLASPEASMVSILEGEECDEQVRMYVFLLSIHCLRYGALFSSICYGLSAEMNCYTTLGFLKEFA
ncbi:hypothetical protein DH2020_007935 [Rehmannia glutinosa]|uniref:SET domain-containing protein n=1 Tax=Rehmannia glutinosa TaxID=99300 RepID=A0ABR0U027_REHGL